MIATRFAVAVHILTLIALRTTDQRDTSERIAARVRTNPVVVRRIIGRLVRAGIVYVHRGPGGAVLTRSPKEISLAEVWLAMKSNHEDPLLPLHPAAQHSGIGHQIGLAFKAAEDAMEDRLARTKLAEVAEAASRSMGEAAD